MLMHDVRFAWRMLAGRPLFSLVAVLMLGLGIGANATIVCGVTIGRYAFIGAGAVVNRDVPAFALMAGVPAKRIGWMSEAGHRLESVSTTGETETLRCAGTKRLYTRTGDVVTPLEEAR